MCVYNTSCRIVESGMIAKFLEDTYQRMREDEISKGYKTIELIERPDVSPMIMSDYLSSTIIYCIPMTMAIISFIVEVCSARAKHRFGHHQDLDEKRSTIAWIR